MAKFDCRADIEICDTEVMNYVKEHFYPEDVFCNEKLKLWAEENGFVKDGE
jgi:hypothetical protein